MSRASELVTKFKGIQEQDDAGAKKMSGTVTGVKDAELAKTFMLDVGKTYQIQDADGAKPMVVKPGAEPVALADIKKAYDIEVTKAVGEQFEDPNMIAIRDLLKKDAKVENVKMTMGGLEFTYDSVPYLVVSGE